MLGSFFMENNYVHDHIMFRRFYCIFACTMQCYIFEVFSSDFID